MGKREKYNLRAKKEINYKEKDESVLEEEVNAIEDDEANKAVDVTKDNNNGEEPNEDSDVICPVCWSSLLVGGVEVLAMGCGHLVCGDCVEEVVLGDRGCPVCRDVEGVRRIRRIFL